ncbi:uncharacterized protein JCM15063_001909 [Sporobolomyces koalae]|uniref:uncharacterized protein n=1 Tax=Sporobolomyces koalae TaxID=500713 RepID=UPI00316FCC09
MADDGSSSPPRSLPSALSHAARSLVDFASRQTWSAEDEGPAASSAKAIADGLKNHALRTELGVGTGAIAAVASLLERATSVKLQTELCRVVGNACFDHDENRQLVLDANIPLLIAALVARTTQADAAVPHRRRLTIDELKLLRASTGATLNSSLKFDPIRREVAKPESVRSLLSLVDNRPDSRTAEPVYVVGMHYATVPVAMDVEEWQERLAIGEQIASWTMNILEDVLSEDNSQFPAQDGIPILASILLSLPESRTTSISSSEQLSRLSVTTESDEEEEDSELDTSIEMLSVAASLLEGLALDHPIPKQTIALATYQSDAPSPSSSLLYQLLDFVELAEPPHTWPTRDGSERQRLQKTIETVKAATIRAIVECTNDDLVMQEVWKWTTGTEDGQPKNWLIEKLVKWLSDGKNDREDLTVCASHMLAGLGRSDASTESLVHDYALVGMLSEIIERRVPLAFRSTAGEDSKARENTQILYGVVSLMRHLAIPLKNRPIVSKTRIVATISRLLEPSVDIVKPLQMSVVGLLKHLTNLDVPNSLDALSPTNSDSSPLDRILALIKRTDELQLRSESTRILINLIRTFFSASSTGPTESQAIQLAKESIAGNAEIVEAVSEQVRLSGKYPVLVNEGIVALSLLSTSGGEIGASNVLSSLLSAPLAPSPSPAAETSTQENESSVTLATRDSAPLTTSSEPSNGDPPTAFDMLCVLASVDTPAIPGVRPEMISNVCTLLVTTLKNAGDRSQREKVELKHRLRALSGRIQQVIQQKQGIERDQVRAGFGVLAKIVDE